jgi:GT2 family glycosyltransferase
MDVTSKVWLVVLNWNNGRDTMECLDSILAVADPAIAGVLVCDNASTDDSVEQLCAWGRERSRCWVELGSPSLGCRDEASTIERWRAAVADGAGEMPIALVHTGANLGYAGGNNVGLRLMLAVAGAEDAALVLNNDTLLTPACVSAMAAHLAADPRLGMCGATVVYARDGRTIQARAGAAFQPWFGRAVRLGTFETIDIPADVPAVEARLDYVLGAALLVSRSCLEKVGLMHEGYFLYFEEIDWCLRARRAGFRLGYAKDAFVLHKEGGTIGSSHVVARRSFLADHYLTRSRVRFTWRFYPWFLPSVVVYCLLQALHQMIRLDFARAGVQVRALFGLAWRP